jgi:hypothetical protein
MIAHNNQTIARQGNESFEHFIVYLFGDEPFVSAFRGEIVVALHAQLIKSF